MSPQNRDIIPQVSQFLTDRKMMFPAIDVSEIISLCKTLTYEYDASHDLNHHLSVFYRSIDIYLRSNPENYSLSANKMLLILIVYASLLHDTIDHKYPNNLEEKKETLERFLKTSLDSCEMEYVSWIINNLSYSKEKKNGYPIHLNPIVQLARNIVSDADKLEAIGLVGLTRCEIFTKYANPDSNEIQVKDLVIQHYHDKLSTLDIYIRTPAGKEFALPLMEEMTTCIEKYYEL